VTLLSSWLISRWISGPIRELTRTAESLCVENLKIDLDDRLTMPQDEIGVLGTAFKKMVTNLRRSTTSIDNLNREIYERKKVDAALRERDERFRQVTENAGDLIWEVDAEGLYTYMSPIVEEMLGYKAEEIVGKKHFYDLFPTESRDETKEAAFAAFNRQETFRGFVNHNIHKTGRLVILETNGTPIVDDDGNLRGYRGVDRDITERRRAEQVQSELLKRLEDTNRELQDFAYIVSHDLKAPLRGIKTLADWLATDYEDKLDDEGKSHLGLLKGRVDHMRDLIDGILQYSRVGRVMDEIAPVDLAKLIPSIVDALAPPANITVTVADNLPVIEAERTKAVQVFQNLLSNAIKYMDKPEGHIAIECVETDGYWKFSVTDDGPGIDEKHFAKIFQMFQTLSPRDEYESTGVGLALVKKIVEMHGGSIWVESEPGIGSTFLFTWPTTLKGHTDAKLQTHTAC
jgi:PAS domain S-box-containing protein